MSGKGDRQRPTDHTKYSSGWDRIFKPKPEKPKPESDRRRLNNDLGTR